MRTFLSLVHTHSRISHRGRQITEKWLQENHGIKPHREVLHVLQSIEVISDLNSTQVEKPNHNLEQNSPNSLEVEENDPIQTEERQRK